MFEIEQLEQQNQPVLITGTVIAGASLFVGAFGVGYFMGSDF